jgi:hypothetical protein
VDQISPPFRIAIVAMLAACALWFTVLKPKDPAASTATAPGVTGLSNDVDAAKGAAAASDEANAKVQAATGGTSAATTTAKKAPPAAAAAGKSAAAATPAATAKPKPKATTGDAAAPLLAALDAKHAVVLVFWNRRGSDDRAVRRAVTAVNRHHGKVVVKAAPIADVGRYEAITRGAQILQSPTVLVIGPDRKARAIVGFTTSREVGQLVGDTLAAAK